MFPGIVLAESAYGGVLTKISRKRLNKGIKLIKNGIVDKLILSGGVRRRNGCKKFIGNNFSLAEIMKKYALSKGVKKSQIILEDLSEDTVGQLIILKQGILDPAHIDKAVIIVNDDDFFRVKREISHIFGKDYLFSYNLINSNILKKGRLKKERIKSLSAFYDTFKGVDFSNDQNVLKTLLEKHFYYNHDFEFYKQGLDKMILENKVMIPYGKQTIDKEDILAVTNAMKSNFLTTGLKVKEFEEMFANYVGAKYAATVSNGTAALHLACLATKLKKADEVITTPITFAASANCALYCGAKPVFADITNQGLINPKEIKKKITKKTKIIIPVHYSGLTCEMQEIKKIADKNNLIIIEDGCQALGAKYKDSKIGSCQYGDMTVFSFHPVKHITTGEGGMITTNSKKLYDRLITLRTHGITKDPTKLTKKDQPGYCEMQELGFNYRLTDFQCALGSSQLNKSDNFIKTRRKIAENYDLAFKDNKDMEIINENEDQFNSYHLYLIKLKSSKIRRQLYDYLKSFEIYCQVHHIPVYSHPYYKKLGYKKTICKNAEDFYNKILSIPMYPTLKKHEQEYVIKKIKEFFKDQSF